MDGRALEGRRTGVGRYVYEICRELDRILPEAEFFVYSREPVEVAVSSDRWHHRTERHRWARNMKPIAWLKLRAGGLCLQDCLDVFWGSATLFPTLSSGVRRVTTVYDLTFRVAPETMGSTHLMAQRLFFRRDVERAHQRTAISQGTADRLRKWLGGPPPVVIPPAVSAAFGPADPAAVSRTLASLGIAGPYFLAVATWEPRKNLELLISVVRALQAEGEFQDHRLVLAGGPGWKENRLRRLLGGGLDSHVAADGAVMPLGFVTDEQLAHLYAGCRAFVFPSMYEGFGIPLLEARACGAAIVTTDLPEMREAGGESAVYVPPTSAGLRDGLRRAGSRPAPVPSLDGLPSWRESATKLARYLRAD